jgi:gas vesicle protein
MKNTDVVVGVLSGLAVGVLLGVLFAPDKGSNTRKKIAQKGTDLKDNLKGSFSDFIASVEDQYSNFSSNTDEVLEEGKSKLERMGKEITK